MKYLRIALALTAVFLFGCKPYDDSALWEKLGLLEDRVAQAEAKLPQLNTDIGTLSKLAEAMESQVTITSVTEVDGGFLITFSDKTSYKIVCQTDGESPYIGSNGNWWIGKKDTGVKAAGTDGLTPYVGSNGNWWIGTKDTGVSAMGIDGNSGYVGPNGNWWLGKKDSGVYSGSTPPVVGIKEFEGRFYWTLTIDACTVWLTDKDGNKLPVAGENGVTPVLSYNSEGNLVISYDGGVTTELVLNSSGLPIKQCECPTFFLSVSVKGSWLTIILVDGTVIRIRIKNNFPDGMVDVLDPFDPGEIDPHMPLYDGDNPPFVEGAFRVKPFVTVYCEDEGRGGFTPGTVVAPIVIRFSNQDRVNNTVDFDRYGGNTFEHGTGAFIRGEGDNFTVFFNTEGGDGTVRFKKALVISGTMVPEGIKDLYYSFIMVEKENDTQHRYMDAGVFRIFYDSDHISEYCTWDPPYHVDPPSLIDLGLPSGVLWGSCNVGASHPWEYGDYFAWGETSPKTSYAWNGYLYWAGSGNRVKKYVLDADFGTVDNLSTLDENDDVASTSLGEKFRMPTSQDFSELLRYGRWTWTQMEGVWGYEVKSTINGKTIFLPAAGLMNGTNLASSGRFGYYWSASLNGKMSNEGVNLTFGSTEYSISGMTRYFGCPVRPVFGDRYEGIIVTSIILDPTVLELAVGQTATVACNVYPVNATNPKVTWTSSNPKVASVSSDGVIKGVSVGEATITATTVQGGLSASCEVFVVKGGGGGGGGTMPDEVDLGLPSGTIWGSCNLGASHPWDTGDYYAWGETAPKSSYNYDNYKYYTKSGSYWNLSKYYENDNLRILEATDDAATVKLKGNWRIPTASEFEELIQYCDTKEGTLEGVKGCYFYSRKYSGRYIFLPVAGEKYGNNSMWTDLGCYSSSVVNNFEYGRQCFLYFGNNELAVDYHSHDAGFRIAGLTIRPVKAQRKSYVKVTGVDSFKSVTLKVGESMTLYSSDVIKPATATYKGVNWVSSDYKTVDYSNYSGAYTVITGKAVGKATITATTIDGGYEATCSVTVVNGSGGGTGPQAVDLGLPSGTKWASYNLGAQSPEEEGSSFAWGEISTKTDFTKENYRFYDAAQPDVYKKYNKSDRKTLLDYSDDAARAIWGGDWRMPTKDEWKELFDNCTTKTNGTGDFDGGTGLVLTSKINGNSIFILYNYYRTSVKTEILDGDGYAPYGPTGHYYGYGNPYCEKIVDPTINYYGGNFTDNPERYEGWPIRPVIGSRIDATKVSFLSYKKEMKVGDSFTFEASCYPSNSRPSFINWESSKSSVLSMSKDGDAKAISPGKSTVYAIAPNGVYATLEVTVTGDGYHEPEPVNLGLTSGIYWASFNLGATAPEEYGDYFAWGETDAKTSFSWSNYKYCNGTEMSLTKYNTMASFGSVDDITSLQHSDDPCKKLVTYTWMMPTKDNFDELMSECTWTPVTQNGVKGYKVTGKNGKYIFLPAAGYKNGADLENGGTYGYYWSKDLFTNYPSRANYLFFNDNKNVTFSLGNRMAGHTIRPVTIILSL